MWPSGKQRAQISKRVERGGIKPFIDTTSTLEQAQEALDYSQSARAKGKMMVTVK